MDVFSITRFYVISIKQFSLGLRILRKVSFVILKVIVIEAMELCNLSQVLVGRMIRFSRKLHFKRKMFSLMNHTFV